MTHPIVEAVAAKLDSDEYVEAAHADDPIACARIIVAEVLRLAREPSAAVVRCMMVPNDVYDHPANCEAIVLEWRAGIDALRREVEER